MSSFLCTKKFIKCLNNEIKNNVINVLVFVLVFIKLCDIHIKSLFRIVHTQDVLYLRNYTEKKYSQF